MSGDLPLPSDETLLGYILGGLSDEENAEIEALLLGNPSLQQRLRDLRSLLEPLAEEFLAEEFLAEEHLVEESPDKAISPSDIPSEGQHETLDLPPAGLIEQTLWAIEQQSKSPSPTRAFALSQQFHSAESQSTRVAWLDSLVALAAGIVVLSFLLPGILRWRESARQHECAENLRHLGSALISFAQFQPTHRLPAIEPQGPLSFAGVYAIRLQDKELLDTKRWLQCPGEPSSPWLANIPTSQQYLQAPESKRYVWRMLAGGDYSYHMGSIVEDKYQAPSIESSARVAWIGDRWPAELHTEPNDEDFELHGNRGLNVLYNDGSVQWLKLPKLQKLASIDHPYLNHHLKVAPGIGEADACLGPSHLLPAIGATRPSR
jgi:prepilin-type processing-associated H-X9-DG protein